MAQGGGEALAIAGREEELRVLGRTPEGEVLGIGADEGRGRVQGARVPSLEEVGEVVGEVVRAGGSDVERLGGVEVQADPEDLGMGVVLDEEDEPVVGKDQVGVREVGHGFRVRGRTVDGQGGMAKPLTGRVGERPVGAR